MIGMTADGFYVSVFIRDYGGGDDYSAQALVDTGASHSLISKSLADQLNLPTVGERDIQTANGYVPMDVVFGEVALEGQDYQGAQFLVTPTDGLVAIGYDLVTRLGLLVPGQLYG